MATYTKPCTRPGCSGTCVSFRPSQHARKRYCSNACATAARVAAGIKPPRKPREHYVALGRLGGQNCGRARRKRATLTAAKDFAAFIPSDMEERMTAEDYRRVLALLARAWRRGWTVGRATDRTRRRERRKQRSQRPAMTEYAA